MTVLQRMRNVCFSQVVIAVLLIACNRDAAVRRSLDLLIKYRPSQARFPITVSQDCGHQPTKEAILSYGDQVSLIEVCSPSLWDKIFYCRQYNSYPIGVWQHFLIVFITSTLVFTIYYFCINLIVGHVTSHFGNETVVSRPCLRAFPL